jgi:hypothetical protein
MIGLRTAQAALVEPAPVTAGQVLRVLGDAGSPGMSAVQLGKVLGTTLIAADPRLVVVPDARHLSVVESRRHRAHRAPGRQRPAARPGQTVRAPGQPSVRLTRRTSLTARWCQAESTWT